MFGMGPKSSSGLTEAVVAALLATHGVTDAQARASISSSASLVAGLQALGLIPAPAAATPVTVDPVAPTPSPTAPDALRPFKFIGQNLAEQDIGRDAFGAAVVNKAVTSDPWSSGGAPMPANELDANGFPLVIGKGGYNETIVNVESVVTRPGVENVHVCVSNCDVSPAVDECIGGAYLSDTTDVNGVRRIRFKPNPAVTGPRSYPNGINVFMHAPKSSASGGFFALYHEADEPEYLAGRVWRQQFVDRVKPYGQFRFMDWLGMKSTFGNAQVEFSERRHKDSVTWAGQVPLEHCIGLCNETGNDGWFNIPHSASKDYARKAGAMIHLLLRPDLRGTVEVSNEIWDPNSEQYRFFSRDTWPLIAGSNDKAWGASGYRIAELMAEVREAANYSSRIRPWFGGQGSYLSVLQGVVLGIKRKLADWADKTSSGYNADRAARYREVRHLFASAGVAPYIGAGMGRKGWPQQDKDLFHTWARASDDSGKAAFFRQLLTGSEMSDPDHFNIAALPTTYGPTTAFLDELGLSNEGYESCLCVEDFTGELDAESIAFRTRCMHDDKMVGVTIAAGAAWAQAGFERTNNLTELSENGGAYGSREDPFDGNYPREIGLLQVNANQPAPRPLTISYAASGAMKVGLSPTITFKVTGGRGVKTLVVNGLPSGCQMEADQGFGARVATGKLTTQASYHVVASVTDESGRSANLEIDLVVGAAPNYKTGQMLRVQVLESTSASGTGAIDIDAIEAILSDGTRQAVWTGDNDRAPLLNKPDGNTYYSGNVKDYGITVNALGDFGENITPIGYRVTRSGNVTSTPGKWKAWLAPKGGQEVLVLDVNETDNLAWEKNIVRDFEAIAN